MSVLEFAVIIAAALLAVSGVFLLQRFKPSGPARTSAESQISFLFNGTSLVHATPRSLQLIDTEGEEPDWSMLRQSIVARFPMFPRTPPDQGNSTIEIKALNSSDDAVVRIYTFGEHARVELLESTREEVVQATHDYQMLKSKHDRLQRICDAAPYPIWQVDSFGQIVWSNSAYDFLADRVALDPEKRSANAPILELKPTEDAPRRARASVSLTDKPMPSWYDVTATPQPDGVVNHATNIDAVIRAEIAQRNFVQTLAKTFAQLSIGLAIFDRNGQLALFNPALVDLSGLPAVFLSTRPDLLTFFDRLRDNRMMPEPKNYSSWRQEIATVIKAATDGTYQETWMLDNGLTYRVSGRPHPDGAVAFLIEDISAEISLTRNFRAELEMGQSLMDTFDDGLVVFSSAGVLTFCNKAYRDMWKVDPDKTFADISIHDSVNLWTKTCRPNPSWAEIREFVMKIGDRVTWDTCVEHEDGTRYFLTISPVASGSTMVRFEQMSTVDDAGQTKVISASG